MRFPVEWSDRMNQLGWDGNEDRWLKSHRRLERRCHSRSRRQNSRSFLERMVAAIAVPPQATALPDHRSQFGTQSLDSHLLRPGTGCPRLQHWLHSPLLDRKLLAADLEPAAESKC